MWIVSVICEIPDQTMRTAKTQIKLHIRCSLTDPMILKVTCILVRVDWLQSFLFYIYFFLYIIFFIMILFKSNFKLPMAEPKKKKNSF